MSNLTLSALQRAHGQQGQRQRSLNVSGQPALAERLALPFLLGRTHISSSQQEQGQQLLRTRVEGPSPLYNGAGAGVHSLERTVAELCTHTQAQAEANVSRPTSLNPQGLQGLQGLHGLPEGVLVHNASGSVLVPRVATGTRSGRGTGITTSAAATVHGREMFPDKLYRMLQDTEEAGLQHIVSFAPSGKCFRVHNVDLFTTTVMPKYFSTKLYPSFQRQLTFYGFSRFTDGPNRGYYQHPRFIRGQQRLCNTIPRPKRRTLRPTQTTGDGTGRPSPGPSRNELGTANTTSMTSRPAASPNDVVGLMASLIRQMQRH